MVQEELNILTKKTNPNTFKEILGNSDKERIYNFLSDFGGKNKGTSKMVSEYLTNPKLYGMKPNSALNQIGKNVTTIKTLHPLVKLSRVSSPLGVALSAIDAKRSFEIADAMERINKNRPGSFNQKDIDYYRNKGRWITGGSLAGAGIGGTAGALSTYGIGAGAGAMLGTGIGGGITSLGYELLNRYKPKQMTQADWTYLRDINNNIQNKPKKDVKKENKPKQNNIVNQQYGPSSSIEDLIKQQQNKYGTYNPTEEINTIGQNTLDAPEEYQAENTELNNQRDGMNIGDILDRYNNISNIRQGYLDKLQSFIDNYDVYNNKSREIDRYLAGIAGWSGNNNFAKMIGMYNPANIELAKLNLYQKLAEGQIQNEKDLANIVSNARVMERMGIDPSIAMADSKTLNNITKMLIADRQAKSRMDIAKLNAHVKDLDRQARIAIAQGRREDAFKLLALRNQANAQIAAINSIGFGGDPTAIYQAMSGFGYSVPNYQQEEDNINPYE